MLFFFFGYLGAKFLSIVIYASKYQGLSIQTVLNTSGSAYLGTPLLGFLALWIFSRNAHIPFLVLADYAVPFLMLERILGRIGCLAHGCCYGITSNLPWAYPFWKGQPRHPTQAYAFVCALAIFISSRYLYKKTRDAPGVTFFYVILSYSALRFLNECLRAQGPFAFGPIKWSHVALFAFATAALIGLLNLIKKLPAESKVPQQIKSATARLFIWLVLAGTATLLVLSFR